MQEVGLLEATDSCKLCWKTDRLYKLTYYISSFQLANNIVLYYCNGLKILLAMWRLLIP